MAQLVGDFKEFNQDENKSRSLFSSSNVIIIGLIIVIIIAIGLVSYLIVLNKPIERNIPAAFTPSPTYKLVIPSATAEPKPTIIAEPTKTVTLLAQAPSITPIPLACGVINCDNTTNPCQSGLICISGADGNNYCSLPVYKDSCSQNPSQISCCTASYQSPTPTPTEIVLVNATVTSIATATSVPQVTELPTAGVTSFGTIFALLSIGVIFLGLVI